MRFLHAFPRWVAPAALFLVLFAAPAPSGSVACRTENATAKAGEDYIATSGTLHWADGDTAPKPVTATLVNDAVQEEREDFVIGLENPIGGATLATLGVAVTVIDDDSLPAFLGSEIEAASSPEG